MNRIILSIAMVASALLLISCQNEDAPRIEIQNGIPSDPHEISPLLIGDTIPAARLKTSEGRTFDLDSALKRRHSIIIYYRGGWCFFCNQHLGQIHEIEQQLRDIGYQIFAVSADVTSKARATASRHNLGFELLSDSDMATAKEIGIAYKVSDRMFDMYLKDMGADIEEASGHAHRILPVPSVFITDTTGKIMFEYINPDFRVRLHPDVLLAAAKAYKNYNVRMK